MAQCWALARAQQMLINNSNQGRSHRGSAETNLRMQVRSLASFRGLRIRCCHELWCRSQTQFVSYVAVSVAEAGSYCSNSTPSLGTCIYRGCGPKERQKNKITVITAMTDVTERATGLCHGPSTLVWKQRGNGQPQSCLPSSFSLSFPRIWKTKCFFLWLESGWLWASQGQPAPQASQRESPQ